MRLSSLIIAAGMAATTIAAHAAPASYAIDPSHTFVTFEATHFGTSTNRGRFDQKEGTVELDKAAKTGKVDITIQATSVNTGVAPFNKHLQSADFFNTAEHPTIRFVSDKMVFDGDKVTQVQGQLTLLGKTAPATLQASQFNCYQNPMLKREVCGGDFETTIDRTTWGMNYGVANGMPKNVRLVIQVEAIKQP